MAYCYYNPNPYEKRVGDCTVRAIAKALNKEWKEIYAGLCAEGFAMGDMPSSDAVWGAYLRGQGFNRKVIPECFPCDYTVLDFCRDFSKGIYILAISGHVVCVIDGDYYDAWDSGKEVPVFYWEKRGR